MVALPSAVASALLPVLVALGAAVAVDSTFGEPPRRLHPVAWFGSTIEPFDRRWSRPRSVGVVVAVGLPLVVAAVAGVAVAAVLHGVRAVTGVAAALDVGWILGPLVVGAILSTTMSLRMLLDVTAAVVALTASEPEAARESVRALVGRETATLSPSALRSAAVESAAENLADGFVAPLVGFVVGAVIGGSLLIAGVGFVGVSADVLPLSLGVAGAVWVKAVNTLDSMLGYRSKPVGWASARLDDAVMYVPARTTAVCLVIAAVAVYSIAPGDTLTRVRQWAELPSSPNAGWPMAAAAAVLDVRLAKSGHYALNPEADLPTPADAERAVTLVRLAGVVAIGAAAATLVAAAVAMGWLAAQPGGSLTRLEIPLSTSGVVAPC